VGEVSASHFRILLKLAWSKVWDKQPEFVRFMWKLQCTLSYQNLKPVIQALSKEQHV